MKNFLEKTSLLIKQITQNKKLHVSESKLFPAYTKEYLAELEQGLEVSFDLEIKDFFTQVGGISISWSVNKLLAGYKIPESDLDFISGAIQVLNPFDMIMGRTGTKWKDVLWFENMEETKKNDYKSFIPFDFPGTDLIAGFRRRENHIANEIFLYDNNNGITDLKMTLEQYFDKLIATKGFNNWQEFLLDKNNEEYDRFMKFMPYLFDDFNTENSKNIL